MEGRGGEGKGRRKNWRKKAIAKARERERERERGSSPFYSESGTPSSCQITVGQSLDKMLTIMVYDKKKSH